MGKASRLAKKAEKKAKFESKRHSFIAVAQEQPSSKKTSRIDAELQEILSTSASGDLIKDIGCSAHDLQQYLQGATQKNGVAGKIETALKNLDLSLYKPLNQQFEFKPA